MGQTVPVIILTRENEERVTSWINNEHLDFFKKENWMMGEVVTKVQSRLGIS